MSTPAPPKPDSSQLISLGRLIAGIVHDINTPVGSILSNNQIARRALEKIQETLSSPQPDAAKALKHIEMLKALAEVDAIACERIVALVRSVKTFARGDEGQVMEADINESLRGTLRLMQCGFGRRVQVEMDLGDIPKIPCYPQKLNQVFLNLLVNAGEAIRGEGTIHVRTSLDQSQVLISISDTGHGISPENLSRLFSTPFSTKASGEGTGMGLMMCKEIVVGRHGGSLDVESKVGEGTTFHVRLPLQRAATSSQ